MQIQIWTVNCERSCGVFDYCWFYELNRLKTRFYCVKVKQNNAERQNNDIFKYEVFVSRFTVRSIGNGWLKIVTSACMLSRYYVQHMKHWLVRVCGQGYYLFYYSCSHIFLVSTDKCTTSTAFISKMIDSIVDQKNWTFHACMGQ